MKIHARLFSLGGGVLAGVAFALCASLVLAFSVPNRHGQMAEALIVLLLALFVYLGDAWSETLILSEQMFSVDSWLKREQRFFFSGTENVLLVHEGLNSEIGVETLIIRRAQGEECRIALGPLWRRRDLEAFLRELEKRVGKKKLVEEAR